MLKQTAIDSLGGSIQSTADAIGISYVAVYKWPDVLSARLSDRVEAAVARKAAAVAQAEEELKAKRRAARVARAQA